MKNILIILRGELRAYFTRPIGYIYLVTFILFTNMLGLFFLRPFFDFPTADMRHYFHVFAGVSSFLIAAATMRLWAEEREKNTYEMLLTFPMRAHQLVLGKFLASMTFFCVGLACTLTVPLMMMAMSWSGEGDLAQTGWWGLLDPGATASGYFGAVLLGGLFVSFGLFVSGLCRDQIVAFVLTAPALFSAYVLGVDFFKNALNSALSFLGSEVGYKIADFVGIFLHYDNLARGLIDGADLVFFLIWIAIFLILNGLAIERRCRPRNLQMYMLSALLLVGIGLAANYLTMGSSLGRMDVTEEKLFTVDRVSVEVLKRLRDPVSLRYVVSPRAKLPPEWQNLERDVRDKLDALRLASGGMLKYEVVVQEPVEALKEEMEGGEDESGVEKRILKKIRPFSVEVSREGESTAQLVFSGLEISYLDKESEVVSPLDPRSLPQLEYFLVKFIDKMTREKAPVVAMVAPLQEIHPQMAMFYRQMGRPVPPPEDPYEYLQGFLQRENFDVRRVQLSKQAPLPEEYDVLVVVGPENLNERQRWEVNRALVNGKSVFVAAQTNRFEYKAHARGLQVRHTPVNPGINQVLVASGIGVSDEVLMDPSGGTLQMPVNTPFGAIPQTFPKLEIHAEIRPESMNQNHPILQGISAMRYYWGSPLALDNALRDQHGIRMTPLLTSNRGSWKRAVGGEYLAQADLQPPPEAAERMLLAALFEGQFQDAFAGKPAPDWPDEPEQMPMPPAPAPGSEPGPVNPAPGRLVLLANAEVLMGSRSDLHFLQWNQLNFFLNVVSYLGLDETGRSIRALQNKTSQVRAMGQTSREDPVYKQAGTWKVVQVVGHLAVLTAAGVAIWLWRRRRREAFLASQPQT